MGPLFLVNWHDVNVRFRGLMWLVAFALALVILLHAAPASRTSHHPPRALMTLPASRNGKP